MSIAFSAVATKVREHSYVDTETLCKWIGEAEAAIHTLNGVTQYELVVKDLTHLINEASYALNVRNEAAQRITLTEAPA